MFHPAIIQKQTHNKFKQIVPILTNSVIQICVYPQLTEFGACKQI